MADKGATMFRALGIIIPLFSLLLSTSLQAKSRKEDIAHDAYLQAKNEYASLKINSRQRKYRDQWMAIANQFERVAQTYPKSKYAPFSLFNIARLHYDLWRVSNANSDWQFSIRTYQKLAKLYPRSSLVDDAWLAVGLIFRDQEKISDARAAFRKAIAFQGDVRAQAQAALSSPASFHSQGKQNFRDSSEANSAYFQAKKEYDSLKNDPRRRQYRDQWMAVASHFEKVAKAYPESHRAPQALFNTARLYSDLSRVSLAQRDLKLSIETYKELARSYPQSSLADDAWMEIGLIYRDRKGDTAKAQAAFRAAVVCHGDMHKEAQAALSSLAPYQKSNKTIEEERMEIANLLLKNGLDQTNANSLQEQENDEEDQLDSEEEKADDSSTPLVSKNEQANRIQALQKAGRKIPLSVQVGLKIKRIVIDPGHGGHDPGAVGPTGLREKTVTLQVAQKLKAELEQDGFEVFLTRDQDRFISLESRARFANRQKGDLFISLHCNAHKNRKLRGVETYTLNVTSNRYAIRLAARENASSERSVSDLQFVLADLATKANTSDSLGAARAIQSQLVAAESEGRKRPIRNLGVKQALFYVLLGARMPSVLVELAFISNRQDEKLLRTSYKQTSIAQAITDGVKQFIAEREAVAQGNW
jgi:N-acetylmuramoyl-L-alanine amidase